MRCIYDINNRQFIAAQGGFQAMAEPKFYRTRRDSESLDLQLVAASTDGQLVAQQLASNFDLRFACKRVGNWDGPAVVYGSTFAYRPTDGCYRGQPSFDTDELTAMFVQAVGVHRFTADHTVAATDIGYLLAINDDTAKTVTVPASLGADGDAVYVLCVDAAVTIAEGSGVTITRTADLDDNLVTMGQVRKLTRTSATAWTLSKPTELDEVEVMAEFTWRDLGVSPAAWTSTKDGLTFIVTNDVNRGDEAAPQNPGEPTEYVTWGELDVAIIRADVAQSLSDEQKAQALANIGAVNGDDVVKLSAQTLSDPQKAQVLDNIGAAAQADLDATDATAAALATTVAGKASASALSTLDATVTALSAVAVKTTAQTLTAPQKAQVLANIGAAAATSERAFVRLAARFNPVGNGTTVSLDGALNSTIGTATARNVAIVDAGHAVSSISGTTFTCAGFTGVNDQFCQFTGTTLPAGVTAGVFYYLRDVVAGVSFAVAATVGGAAISVSGSIGALKVMLPLDPYYRHRRIGFISSTTAGTSCGTRHSLQQWAVSTDPALGGWTFCSRFAISDAAAVAGGRMFVGLVATTASLPNANPSTQHNLIGLGCDSGDTVMSIIHNDASGTATKIALSSSFPANTRNKDLFELVLFCNPDLAVTYKVTNLTTGIVTQGNLATDLPIPLQTLAIQHWRNNGSTALSVGIDVVQWTMEQG